jgi:hypothetical protein
MSPGRDRYVVEVTILRRTAPVSARADASEPTRDYSTWSALSLGLLGVGLAGAAMLVAADLSTLVEIKVVTVVKERLSGHGQHAWAIAVLGVAALPLVWGAARRRARPAMIGLIALGAVALIIALAKDLPDTRSTGVIGERYESAAARPGPGFYLETGGALLLALAGVGGLVLMPAKSATRRASGSG